MNPNQEKNEESGKSSDHLYLERLRFDPKLKETWLNFFVSRFRVVLLLIAIISAWGIYSFIELPRESNPEVKIPIAVVSTVYAGVSPADIEELVTKKVEAAVSGLKGIDTISSRSANSVSMVTVEFDPKEDLDDSIRKLKEKVDSIKAELPEDASEPQVMEISFDDTPVWSAAVSGPYDGLTLRRFAENIKDELEKIPGVREVRVSGGDEEEFEIALDPAKLSIYKISPDQAKQAVQALNLAFPAGSFEGREFTYPVRSDSRIFDAKKLENTPISHGPDGQIIYLKDIAKVQEKARERRILSRLSSNGAEPGEAVTIEIIKKTGGSILDTVEEAVAVMDRETEKLEGTEYEVIIDFAKEIDDNFEQLTHDFFLTLILVSSVLFLLVGFKEALVAGLAIPLVFFISFGVMLMTGISLNFLSIFSLLLSLGLLVDDAIVVVSATKQYLGTGKFTPEEAVLLVLNDFKVVLTTTTLATVWAFLPLLMSTGIIGEFIKSIPITVSVTLISSLLIALMVNHPLAAVLERVRLSRRLFFALLVLVLALAPLLSLLGPKLRFLMIVPVLVAIALLGWYFRRGRPTMIANEALIKAEGKDPELIKKKLKEQGNKEHKGWFDRLLHGLINFNAILPFYEKHLRYLLSTRKRRGAALGIVAILFVSSVALPISGIVPSEFFPPSDSELVFIDINAPTGLNLEKTDAIVQQVETRLRNYKEIKNFSSIVGAGSSNSISSMGGGNSSSHLAALTINLIDGEEREVKSYELAKTIREDLESIEGAEILVYAPEGGPPSGSAFEARISGDDLSTLERIANDLKPILASIPGVVNPEISLKESPAEYTFSLDPAKMELYNLNAAYVGSFLRTAISGSEVSTVIRGGEEIDIVARFDKERLKDLSSIENLEILNLAKQPVFIKDVAKVELKPSVDTISRIDQKRVVLLSAASEGDARPAAILAEFEKKLEAGYELPAGYEIIYGGENEQNTESVLSIVRAMVLAGFLIIATMVIQFDSFKKAGIVLATIPFALIGVFFGMAVAGVSLSFPGLIGILALFGIVVKNAIILIDKINLNIKTGIAFTDAVIDAGKSRLEAIFITSICTILGIIPVTLSNEIWMALGTAIIFGLMLSSFLTLFIVPVLYVSLIPDES
jgi:HAE1 family hydrophobic/amphiphilic exporter-1